MIQFTYMLTWDYSKNIKFFHFCHPILYFIIIYFCIPKLKMFHFVCDFISNRIFNINFLTIKLIKRRFIIIDEAIKFAVFHYNNAIIVQK